MADYEKQGGSVEYYTPKYIFEGLNVNFDLDVCSPLDRTFISTPALDFISENSLEQEWKGFIWMNPPYASEKNKIKWIEKFIEHANGVALMPDRTSASWWQLFAKNADCFVFVNDKIKFITENGSTAKSPGNGSTLFALGNKGRQALINFEQAGLGSIYKLL